MPLTKVVVSTPDGHHVAVEVPSYLLLGAASDEQIAQASKAIAVGLNEAHRTYPPAAEV